MAKIIKEYKENGIKITRYAAQKNTSKQIMKPSSLMHQKGSFGWSAPTNKNGVSTIYFSQTNRKPRNGQESKSNGKVNPQKRAW